MRALVRSRLTELAIYHALKLLTIHSIFHHGLMNPPKYDRGTFHQGKYSPGWSGN
jgi:hypothetical protein